ncbi:MAG: hydrogenase maturation nickel metallochaperone HypA [Gemmatimonadota bacterium]|nr:MAG: hydrogenase maturation nickel metallochaperone HypA [Gemmatimonadota bacterium]
MHEMSVALEIGSIVARELAKRPGCRLTGLGVVVGAFSGVQIDTLEFCLEVVMAERYDGVVCEVKPEPGTAQCLQCGRRFQVSRAPFECPTCGMPALGVDGGDSLQVSYLEVE